MEKINCRKSTVQNYECQVCARCPWKEKRSSGSIKDFICFDACLAKELFYLWDKGIQTTGSCCGNHTNDYKKLSYIGVRFEDIPKMKKLGYKVLFNPLRPKDEDSFAPKTKFSQ